MPSTVLPRRHELVLVVMAALLAAIGAYARDLGASESADSDLDAVPAVQMADEPDGDFEPGVSVEIAPLELPSSPAAGSGR